MACALPVVATAVGGTPDLVKDGRTGFLVPSEDEAAMADAIWRCYAEPDQARMLGQSAHAEAVSNFGLDGMVSQYHQLFSIDAKL